MDDRQADSWSQFHAGQRAEMAQGGIQAGMLLNGGAAVAVLALMGNLATAKRNDLVDIGGLKWSLLAFGIGVFLAASTYTVGYMVQDKLAHEPGHATAHRSRVIGVVMVLGSLALFLLGVAIAAMAMF